MSTLRKLPMEHQPRAFLKATFESRSCFGFLPLMFPVACLNLGLSACRFPCETCPRGFGQALVALARKLPETEAISLAETALQGATAHADAEAEADPSDQIQKWNWGRASPTPSGCLLFGGPQNGLFPFWVPFKATQNWAQCKKHKPIN